MKRIEAGMPDANDAGQPAPRPNQKDCRLQQIAPNRRFTPWPDKQADPDEETADWRALCGRTARTVRRAARSTALPDPYLTKPETHHYCAQHLASIPDKVFARPFPCGRDAICV